MNAPASPAKPESTARSGRVADSWIGREAAETRSLLAAAWAALPRAFRGPTQFVGRHYVGCAATIGVMPRCDLACRGCYLAPDANRSPPRTVEEVKAQMRLIRSWLGPAGNLQLTDGEVTLRDESELAELISYARGIGLVPMMMTNGETLRRSPGLLERLMTGAGLAEIALHVDTTMRGRRDGYDRAQEESDLDGLRAEFAKMIRRARKRTGRSLEAVSTVTVTRCNLHGVPGVVRWFLRNADAFKMLSFQPLAAVGRTDPSLKGVTPDELWARIAEGADNPNLRSGEGWFGHSACTRLVQGLVSRRGRLRLVPLYRRDRPEEMSFLGEFLDRLGGTSFRLDGRGRALRRAAWILRHHWLFLIRRALPHLGRLGLRAGGIRPRYFCIVSHHFMDATEAAAPAGRERLSACAFRVAIEGRLEPMCAVNALGLREAFHRSATTGGRAA